MSKRYRKFRELLDRWKRIDKGSIIVIAVVISMFVMSGVVFSHHINDISEKYRELIRQDITTQIGSACLRIEQNIVTKCELVATIANNFSNQQKVEDEEIQAAFDYAFDTSEFVDVLYTDALLKRVYSKRNTYDNLNLNAYISQYDGFSEIAMFDNTEHICTDSNSFVLVAPIKRENRTYGYVVAVAEYVSIEEDIKTNYDIDGDIAIIDEQGRVASVIRDGETETVKDELYFFDKVAESVIPADFNIMITNYEECIRNGTTTVMDAESNGKNIIYIFHSLKGSGKWSIVYCIVEDSINAIARELLITSFISFIIIILLLVIAALAIISHMRKEQQKVANLEYLDGLTGIMNRNAFTVRAEEVLKDNKNLPYYIVCMDILNFRIINETYGHERSDVVIKALADGCKEAYGKNEAYGRLNADVFVALVLNDGESKERTAFLEGKVREAAKTVYINHPIKLKMGYYEVSDYSELVSRMIDKANIARKYIQSNAKELVCTYSDELMEGARKTEYIESKMEMALLSGEFKPYLQAKYDMEKNHICGAEALIRWQKKDGTLVPPGDFIPLFEKNGFIEKVDFYMLEQVCKYLRSMIDQNKDVYPVSVNQSRYLLNDPDYVSKVKEILLKYEIPIGLIELELTETVFMHERERMIEMMNELKYIHVNLSIDDFGSGYSSFNLLKDVPFDVLKIDREFLSDSVHSERSKWILTEIVEMAHGLGMSVICEGVETREQVDMLLSAGCRKAQGFLYARPIPLPEFIEKYNLDK